MPRLVHNSDYDPTKVDCKPIREIEHGPSNGLVKLVYTDNETITGTPEDVFIRAMQANNRAVTLPFDDSSLFQALYAAAYPEEAKEFINVLKTQHRLYSQK